MRVRWLSLTNRLLVMAVGTALSSITLWLIESWVKYPLFAMGLLATGLIYLIASGYDFRIPLRFWSKIESQTLLNIVLIAAPSGLILLQAFGLGPEPPRTVAALISTSFIPGYAILRISRGNMFFSKLETVMLSCILSYVYTGFAWLIMLFTPTAIKTSVLLLSVIILSIGSILRGTGGTAHLTRTESFCKPIDMLALLLAMGLYLVGFLLIYPGFAMLPGTDISRHYASSVVLGRTPDLYLGFAYLLFHLHESAFLYLSNASLVMAQETLLLLNLLLPLSFYVAAKRLVGSIDARLPALATLFWAFFTNSFGGFAWVAFLVLKLQGVGQSQLQLLFSTAERTYNGTIYGIFGLWYVPAGISFIILLSLLSLVPNQSLPRAAFLVIFSTLFCSMFLSHVTDAVILALVLSIYGLLSRRNRLRINESIVSSAVGFVAVLGVYLILSQVLSRFAIGTSLLLAISAPLCILCLVWIFRNVPSASLMGIVRTRSSILGSICRALALFLILMAVFLYSVGLLTWGSLLGSFRTSEVDQVGLVPWFMYPMMTGIIGFLGLTAFYWLFKKKDWKAVCVFLLLLLGVTFLAGRAISYANIFLFQTGYWEKRFVWLLKVPLAMVAPVSVLAILRSFETRIKRSLGQRILGMSLVGLVVLCGFPTTALNIDFWNQTSGDWMRRPSEEEMEAISSLRTIFNSNPRSWLLTLTETSANMVTFASPPDQLGLRQILYTALRPEMAYLQLYRHPSLGHPFIYVADRDAALLSEQEGSFLGSFLKILPKAFQNSKAVIYSSPKPSYPQVTSKVTLVLPFDVLLSSEEVNLGYYLLSGSFADYSVAYDLDDVILDSETLVLSYDLPSVTVVSQSLENEFDKGYEGWQASSGSWSIVNNSLVGGSETVREGVILAPISFDEVNVSFLVSPIDAKSGQVVYAAFVYSFQDDEHFKLASLVFHPDGFVHVLTTAVDGVRWEYGTTNPTWPGYNTTYEWEPGRTYKVDVKIRASSTQIGVNNTDVLEIHATNTKGKVGLFYARSSCIYFDDVYMTGTSSLQLRPIEAYLKFMQMGGTIIVLNTNGFNAFAEQILNLTDSVITSSQIQGGSGYVELSAPVLVRVVSPVASDVQLIAEYKSPNGTSSAYMLRKEVGRGSLIYANVYPITMAFERGNATGPFSPVFCNLLSFLNLPRMPEGIVSGDAYVKRMRLDHASLTSTTVLFPLTSFIGTVSVRTIAGQLDYENVSWLQISGSSLSITSDCITVDSGQGLYSHLKANSTLVLTCPLGDALVQIKTSEGKYTLESVLELRMGPNEKSIEFLARSPFVEARSARLYEVFSQGTLSWRLSAQGEDLDVSGGIEFRISVSDTYSLLEDFHLLGAWYLYNGLPLLSELASLQVAAFWTLVLLPFFLATLIRNRSTKRRRTGTVAPFEG